MHELPVVESVLKIVLQYAGDAKAIQVHRVHLCISELSHLQAEWLQRYFDRLAEGTVAEGALVAVEPITPAFVCERCGNEFVSSLRGAQDVTCPACGSGECRLAGGDDYVVERIEVE